jgi:hypothetical protein
MQRRLIVISAFAIDPRQLQMMSLMFGLTQSGKVEMSTALSINTAEIASLATGFLAKSAEVRRVVADVISGSPEIASAVIMAGQFAIEDAMTEDDKAFIMKGVKKGRVLVEGGKEPLPEKIYAVIAEAESKHLDLGTNQYSVWSNGTLYIKENGFRKLFELRSDCSELDTDIKPPVWMKLQDRSCWHVPVRAWVNVKGRGKISVDCTVGVNGNNSDGINKIEAHAERSVLRKLWKKVTSIPMDHDDRDDTVSSVIVVDEPAKQITQAAIHDEDAKKLQEAAFDGAVRQLKDILAEEPDKLQFVLDVCNQIRTASTLAFLEEAGNELAAMKENYSKTVLKLIRPLYQSRLAELKGSTT